MSSTKPHPPLKPTTTNTDTEPISADRSTPSNESTTITSDITTPKVRQTTTLDTITEERSTSVKARQEAKTTSSATTTQEIITTDTHKTQITTTTTAATAHTSPTTVKPKETASSTRYGTTTIEETATTTYVATEHPVETSPVGTATTRQLTTPGSHVRGNVLPQLILTKVCSIIYVLCNGVTADQQHMDGLCRLELSLVIFYNI